MSLLELLRDTVGVVLIIATWRVARGREDPE